MSRSAVKTNLLINPIDQSKNRGRCHLHTAGAIDALTDFSSPLFSSKSDFLCFQSERKRVEPNAH